MLNPDPVRPRRARLGDVAPAVKRPEAISLRTMLEGRVLGIGAESGPFTEVSVDGQTLLTRITRQSADQLGLVPGMAVCALVKTIAFERRSLNVAPAGDSGAV
jgi:molybdate transport system ATP-binding protein